MDERSDVVLSVLILLQITPVFLFILPLSLQFLLVRNTRFGSYNAPEDLLVLPVGAACELPTFGILKRLDLMV